MPVIGIPVKLLLERIKTTLDQDDLVEHLQHLGCDVEGYATVRRFRCDRCDNVVDITETENPPVLCDRCSADFKDSPEALIALGEDHVIRMELLAVRPDMFDPGGLARVLRNYLGETSEARRYELAPPAITVEVDSGVDCDSCRRPAIACAVIRGFSLNDDLIKVVMKLQENLHWAMGRDRKHASIGVYDLDTLEGTRFTYRSVGPEELSFVPLGYDPARAEDQLTPRAVLEQHPKGKAYARLLADFSRYPLLTDETGRVLSMPPIINSEQTRVKRSTSNFFVDVTGSGDRIVHKCLNILVTSLAELDPGARLEQVSITYPDRQVITPDLTPQAAELDPAHAARIIGVELSREDVEQHLRQMGHAVSSDPAGGPIAVQVPAYRNDIMHPIDLIEDVAIAYGYHNIEPYLVPTMTVGVEQEAEGRMNTARRAMTGLGWSETMTLLLSSPEQSFDSMLLPPREDSVLIDNPISVEQTMIRVSLWPGLLDTFSVNANQELPQRLFEVGNISLLDQEAETGAREHTTIAGGAIGPRVDFAEIRSAAEALLREFGWRMEMVPDPAGCFIPGRGARVMASRGDQRLEVGRLGELHPQVLENYKLTQPVSLFEISLAALPV